jgi:hypothetical protein
MVTAIAFSVLCYSLVVGLAGLATWLLGLRFAALRRAGARITLTFAVFAIAAGYVWLELGPHLDLEVRLRHEPPHLGPEMPIEV